MTPLPCSAPSAKRGRRRWKRSTRTKSKKRKLGVQRDTLAARLWDDYEISLEDALALDG